MNCRNGLYRFGVLKRHVYQYPVIGVGNLRLGGTGKTPMIELLITRLQKHTSLAVLSRGYGRKSKGFQYVEVDMDSELVGDEPSQIKSNFPKVLVAVDANRVSGIQKIQSEHPEIQTILLDDVYQHLSVKPNLLILLTAYDHLYVDDYVLPAGRLRESKSGAVRADIIVVTKCPESLTPLGKRLIKDRLVPQPFQSVFFATEAYSQPYAISDKSILLDKSLIKTIVLITGIASAKKLKDYLERSFSAVNHIEFGDHHWFNTADLDELSSGFKKLDRNSSAIVTTEKDAQRLSLLTKDEKYSDLPIFALPVQTSFFDEDERAFNLKLNEFVRSFA
jgi:tetraacyldisaccharide 4'-kinase